MISFKKASLFPCSHTNGYIFVFLGKYFVTDAKTILNESMPSIRFVRGQRGKFKLVVNGYSYIKNKTYDSKTYWNCAHAKLKRCRSRIITCDDVKDIKITHTNHTHMPEFV